MQQDISIISSTGRTSCQPQEAQEHHQQQGK
ncbi:hypothetical protein LINPERPRIM_LOCUS9805 [Linum perenne]